MWYVSFVNEPIVFSELKLFGNLLRTPLSWLGVSVVAITVGFRPQLHAVTTIVAVYHFDVLEFALSGHAMASSTRRA